MCRHRIRVLALCGALVVLTVTAAPALEPIPDRLVVLTFDDSVRSHFTHVRPLLLERGFGATFFITEGFEFRTNKQDYMTWEQIAQLHQDGFEIGNHTRDHLAISADKVNQLPEQLEAIRTECLRHGIPAPSSFAYPGNVTTPEALAVLADHGILFARRGGKPEHSYESGRGFAYEPGFDHPLLIPSAGDARPNWTLDNFRAAVEQAKQGRVAVLQFHGVPDRAHPWVHTPPAQFERFMDYLQQEKFQVIALRDLARFVDPKVSPRNAQEIIQDRVTALRNGDSRDNTRRPRNDQELKYWLTNMVNGHGFTPVEVGHATGMQLEEIEAALRRFGIERQDHPAGVVRVLPYPGGRHPRIGFRDGAIRPQRDTKISVFTPWGDGGYVVADVPEAIWMDTEDGPELLYLAHTHVPTRWTRLGVELEPVEWTRNPDGTLAVERRLPNGVRFGARVIPGEDLVQLEIWLTNGTDRPLTGLRLQNCIMLKDAGQFNQPTMDNRLSVPPYATCRSPGGDRWLITAWEPFHRAGGNSLCPCLHSDPKLEDCPPGETRRVRGVIAFHEGADINQALERLDARGWR